LPKIAVFTLGCKVNQYDTEAMLESFQRAGYQSVEFDENADVYIINTCTVTGTGDQKSRKLIRRTHRLHPDAGIIAAGCLAQRKGDELLQMDGVRLVIGVSRRAEVVDLFEKAVGENIKISAVEPLKGAKFENLFVTRHEGKTRATMKIQEGCDRFCSYCIIPFVRGPVRSMPVENVRKEACRLKQAGYKEIVITGIHLGSYGRGMGVGLIDAVRAVHDAGDIRVRLGSLEPKTVTDDFARELSLMPGVMHQFHLSMQSGSEGVLKRMNRRYTPDEYMQAVCRLRAWMPDCAITTDVIAGFPGETPEEMEETCAFIQKVAFARIHVFPYSRREGTVANDMKNQVPEDEKHARAARLIEIGNRMEENFVKNLEGSVQEVLFETMTEEGLCEGYTSQYVRVRAKAEPGEIVRVRITQARGASALGEKIEATGR